MDIPNITLQPQRSWGGGTYYECPNCELKFSDPHTVHTVFDCLQELGLQIRVLRERVYRPMSNGEEY